MRALNLRQAARLVKAGVSRAELETIEVTLGAIRGAKTVKVREHERKIHDPDDPNCDCAQCEDEEDQEDDEADDEEDEATRKQLDLAAHHARAAGFKFDRKAVLASATKASPRAVQATHQGPTSFQVRDGKLVPVNLPDRPPGSR